MEQQTAVEWFSEQDTLAIINFIEGKLNQIELVKKRATILEKAKQKEKEYLIEAFYQGVDQESDTHGAMNLDRKNAENYYNETFKTK